jgi:hypothetical protein
MPIPTGEIVLVSAIPSVAVLALFGIASVLKSYKEKLEATRELELRGEIATLMRGLDYYSKDQFYESRAGGKATIKKREFYEQDAKNVTHWLKKANKLSQKVSDKERAEIEKAKEKAERYVASMFRGDPTWFKAKAPAYLVRELEAYVQLHPRKGRSQSKSPPVGEPDYQGGHRQEGKIVGFSYTHENLSGGEQDVTPRSQHGIEKLTPEHKGLSKQGMKVIDKARRGKLHEDKK